MNLRQKKKLFKKKTGHNPKYLYYGGSRYHEAINKPWGGMAELKKRKATRAVENFNKDITRRNKWIRLSHRYIR